jgi:1-deoxy-D-xylulose-5-phosphate synthase
VEDHSVAGGFGAAVLEAAAQLELPIERFARLGIPQDRFIAHGSRAGQLAECGFDATGIAAAVQELIERDGAATTVTRPARLRRTLLPG